MPVCSGKTEYDVSAAPVAAVGASLTEAEVHEAAKTCVGEILRDEAGRAGLKAAVESVAKTTFEQKQLSEILNQLPPVEPWRVGESFGEAFLTEHRNCSFPWPHSRDTRNPSASQAGADLVGFRKLDGAPARFAFGEVKTSSQEQWPPNNATGRHGLAEQLKHLRDKQEVRNWLFRYLGMRVQGAPWRATFEEAASRYLRDSADVDLFGILVREVEPKDVDLGSRAAALAAGCPAQTSVELRAIYVPPGCLKAAAALAGVGP